MQSASEIPEVIFDTLLTESNLFIEELYTLFSDYHKKQLDQLHTALAASLDMINESSLNDRRAQTNILNSYDKSLKNLKEIIQSADYQNQYQQLQNHQTKWENRITDLFPEKKTIHWPTAFFVSLPEDSFLLKLYKKILQHQHVKKLKRKQSEPGSTSDISEMKHPVNEKLFVRYLFLGETAPLFLKFIDMLTDRASTDIALYQKTVNRLSAQLLNVALITSSTPPVSEQDDSGEISLGKAVCNTCETVALLNQFQETTITGLKKVKEEFHQIVNSKMLDEKESFSDCYHKTGTWFYPNVFYSSLLLNRKENKQTKQQQQHLSLWTADLKRRTDDFTHDMILAELQLKLSASVLQSCDIIIEKTETEVLPLCMQAYETLKTVEERLTGLKNESERVIGSKLYNDSRLLLKEFRGNRLPVMINKMLYSGITRDLTLLIEGAENRLEQLSEMHRVIKSSNNKLPPESTVINIPIREIIATTLLAPLKKNVLSFQQSLSRSINDSVNAISEIMQMVEFNIETSKETATGEDTVEDRLSIVTEGISRSLHRLEPLIATIETLPKTVEKELTGIASQWTTGIQTLMEGTALLDMKVDLAKAKATSRLRLVKTKALLYATNFLLRLKSLGEKNIQWLNKSLATIKTSLGLQLPEESKTVLFTQFLIETTEKIKALPFVYQQLFTNEPLTESRLFLERETEMELLQETLNLFGKTNKTIVAVVGESGSGRTTLINMFCRKIEGTCDTKSVCFTNTIYEESILVKTLCEKLGFTEGEMLSDVEDKMAELTKPTVIILENIQKLFIRKIGGIDLLEKFLAFMHSTKAPVFFLCSCTWYSWEYLDKIIGINGQFDKVVSIKPFSRSQTEELILKRHRLTGYTLRFKTDPGITRRKKYRKLKKDDQQQAFLHNLFFEQIHDIASGNASVAILFWMISIKQLSEYELHLTAQVEFNPSVLNGLKQEQLFAIGAVVQHECLSQEDYMQIFRSPPDRNRVLMDKLTSLGVFQEENGLYKIHPFLYRHVIRLLKHHNLIH